MRLPASTASSIMASSMATTGTLNSPRSRRTEGDRVEQDTTMTSAPVRAWACMSRRRRWWLMLENFPIMAGSVARKSSYRVWIT